MKRVVLLSDCVVALIIIGVFAPVTSAITVYASPFGEDAATCGMLRVHDDHSPSYVHTRTRHANAHKIFCVSCPCSCHTSMYTRTQETSPSRARVWFLQHNKQQQHRQRITQWFCFLGLTINLTISMYTSALTMVMLLSSLTLL